MMLILRVVRTEGLEPTCLAALDPKSSASANFATSAKIISILFLKIFIIYKTSDLFLNKKDEN